jgi:hypothetical protein
MLELRRLMGWCAGQPAGAGMTPAHQGGSAGPAASRQEPPEVAWAGA